MKTWQTISFRMPSLRSSQTTVAVGEASEREHNPRLAAEQPPPRSGGTTLPFRTGSTATRLRPFWSRHRGFRPLCGLHPRLLTSGPAGAAPT